MIYPLMTLLGLFILAIGAFMTFNPGWFMGIMSWSSKIYGIQSKPIPGTRFTIFRIIGIGFMLVGIYWIINSIYSY